jgi:UDPglucose 6-dehydrogenase
VLIGEGTKEAGDRLEEMSRSVTLNKPTIQRMSPERYFLVWRTRHAPASLCSKTLRLVSAELTKLAVNCFITMKISFSNMIGDIADRTTGAQKEHILAAVGQDSRIGAKCMQWGYGFGGPCFPRDNRALGCYSSSVGIEPLLTTASDNYNDLHARIMAQRLLDQQLDKVFTQPHAQSVDSFPIIMVVTVCRGSSW